MSAPRAGRSGLAVIAAAVIAACGKGPAREAGPAPETPPTSADGGAPVPADAPAPWPELDGLPRAAPERVIALPVQPDLPRFAVGGPVIAGDLAVVASSQFGFQAVDWRRGTIAWSKPAGLLVAPPLVLAAASAAGPGFALVGDCFSPPAVPAGDRLLGCLRVVSPAGADQAYMPIAGPAAAVEPFAASRGPQALWHVGERTLRWRRGDVAVAVDLISGRAAPSPAAAPPLVVAYRDQRWEVAHEDGHVVARAPALAGGARPQGARSPARAAWRTDRPYTALLGAVYLPDMAPMLRLAAQGSRGGGSMIRVIDMDATGSQATASARPMPGIALLGWDASSVGDVALAIRLDRSLRRDFIAGYAANAVVMWTYPLPELVRPDPIGVAVASDAVVVFHDGDTLTVLPDLSAPPTSPGAVRAPSQNPTP